MIYKNLFLSHFKVIYACLEAIDGDATIDAITFGLEVKARNRYFFFYPQFSQSINGRLSYTPYFSQDVNAFVGWLPYFNKHWPVAREKIAFKEYCQANKLKTPAWSTSRRGMDQDFLVKRNVGSFAAGIEGPFPAGGAANGQAALQEGQFCEQFVSGRIAKVWYWEDRPVALELMDMPSVTGDGRSTLRALVAGVATLPERSETQLSLDDVARTAALQGVELDQVPATGKQAMVDFRYASPFRPLSNENTNVLGTLKDPALLDRLVQAGPLFQAAMPEALRRMTLYSIDAIVDAAGEVWYLEMNCNPVVHPEAYPWIMGSLFGAGIPVAQRRASRTLPGLPPRPARGAPLGVPANPPPQRNTAKP